MSLQTKINGLKEVWQFDNRIWLTLTKTFFSREQLHIYRYKGLEILIDHAAGDANGAREILTSPMYRRFLPQMKLGERAINVLDLGANNGGFPLLLQAEGIKLKKIVSVELNPKTYSRLRFNLERNLHCEIVALHAALCGAERDIKITLGTGSVSDSIYENNVDNKGNACVLRGYSFDQICQTYFGDETIDLCKIDVEGAEFEVFLQPEHQRLKRCRYLIMEIHERGGRAKEDILPAIEKLGLTRQPNPAGVDPTVHLFINTRF